MSKRMSQPAAPANTIVTDSFLLNSVAWPGSEGGCVPLHPFGDFEDEPAETGEAQTPKNHDRDHYLTPAFYRMIASYRAHASNKLLKAIRRLEIRFLSGGSRPRRFRAVTPLTLR